MTDMHIDSLSRFSSMSKSAYFSTPMTDFAFGRLGTRLMATSPGFRWVPLSLYLAGLYSKEDNSNESKWEALIPGVSSFRLGNRIKTQVMREIRDAQKEEASGKSKPASKPVAHAVAEHLGIGTSSAISALIGAGVGAAIRGLRPSDAGSKKNDIISGAEGGAWAGLGAAGLATIASLIASAIKRRRTKKEQLDSDRRSVILKYLVPGMAAYDLTKRMGRSQGEREEAESGSKKDSEKEES